MKPGLSFAAAGRLACGLLACGLLACGLPAGAHAAAPLPASIPSAPVSAAAPAAETAPVGSASATTVAPTTAAAAATPVAAAPANSMATAQPMHLASEAPSATGSLLQTVFGLAFVLALLVGLAWFVKRYGPKNVGGNANLRVVGSLSLGGRERVVVVEVADQWIVVGASPGRVNALATLPRQESLPPGLLSPQNGLAATNFSEWLKQTIDKRNGK